MVRIRARFSRALIKCRISKTGKTCRPIQAPENNKAPGLIRGLGMWAATAVVIGVVIGQSVFLVASDITRSRFGDEGSDGLARRWSGGALWSFLFCRIGRSHTKIL
jgi:hypothetical protein